MIEKYYLDVKTEKIKEMYKFHCKTCNNDFNEFKKVVYKNERHIEFKEVCPYCYSLDYIFNFSQYEQIDSFYPNYVNLRNKSINQIMNDVKKFNTNQKRKQIIKSILFMIGMIISVISIFGLPVFIYLLNIEIQKVKNQKQNELHQFKKFQKR